MTPACDPKQLCCRYFCLGISREAFGRHLGACGKHLGGKRYLGCIWEASERLPGSIWGHVGSIWGASGRASMHPGHPGGSKRSWNQQCKCCPSYLKHNEF